MSNDQFLMTNQIQILIPRQARAFGSEAQVFDSELRLEELEEMILSQVEGSNVRISKHLDI